MKRIDELGISPWPWSAGIGDDDRFVIRDSKGYEIAQAFSGGYDSTIIAAAPELYEALRKAVEFIEQVGDAMGGLPRDVSENQHMAFKALAKAAVGEVAHV